MAQQLKLSPGAHCIPATLLPVQLPAKCFWKAADDGSGGLAPVTYVGDLSDAQSNPGFAGTEA